MANSICQIEWQQLYNDIFYFVIVYFNILSFGFMLSKHFSNLDDLYHLELYS